MCTLKDWEDCFNFRRWDVPACSWREKARSPRGERRVEASKSEWETFHFCASKRQFLIYCVTEIDNNRRQVLAKDPKSRNQKAFFQEDKETYRKTKYWLFCCASWCSLDQEWANRWDRKWVSLLGRMEWRSKVKAWLRNLSMGRRLYVPGSLEER